MVKHYPTYSSGQNKVNVCPACNNRATVIALNEMQIERKTETHLDGPVFGFISLVQFHTCVFHTFSVRLSRAKGNSQVPKPLSSLAKRIQRLRGSTGVTFDSSLIMHVNLACVGMG